MRKKQYICIKIICFLSLLIALYFVFRNGVIDEFVTNLFYDANGVDSVWKQERTFWVRFCYKSASLITAVLGISVVFGYLLSFVFSGLLKYRNLFLFMFLTVALGPGLVVNAVLKDNWGRPRPRETITFGGEKTFQSPFVISKQGGKSFPCGHCSVVFALCGFGYWFGKRSKRTFWLIMVSVVVAGFVMGMARVAVGAHYLSDVLVSGLSVFAVIWSLKTLFPKLLVVSDCLKTEPVSRYVKLLVFAVGIIAGAAMAVFALMSFPFESEDELEIALDHVALKSLPNVIQIVSSDFQIKDEVLIPVSLLSEKTIHLNLKSHGFAVPWSSVDYEYQILQTEGALAIRIHRSKNGLFSELKTEMHLNDGSE